MNWAEILSIIVVIVLYIITYRTIDKKTVARENNKRDISDLLIKKSYQECLGYMDYLCPALVQKYILPKCDFNSTAPNIVISNIQSSPFINEDIVIELIKDGQITKTKLEKYFTIKEKYIKYVTMRITFFDAPELYEPLRDELKMLINNEL